MSDKPTPRRRDQTRHERLKAWHAAQSLVVATYRASGAWPGHERFGLVSQARRAAVSISANVAEGAGRRTGRDFRRFLDIALGSLAELHVYIVLAKELQYMDKGAAGALEALRDHTGRLIWGLCLALDRSIREVRKLGS